MQNLLEWQDQPDATWERLVNTAVANYRAGKSWNQQPLSRSLALMFFNPSLRTRTSMELAGAQLGAHVTTLTPGQGTWNFAWDKNVKMDGLEAENIQDAVSVLSRYYDAIGVRIFASKTDLEQDRTEKLLNIFAEAASVPVINLESAFYHPCQALSDAAAIRTRLNGNEKKKKFVLTWAPHPRALPMAVANSALLMAARLGMEVTVARPDGFGLDESVMSVAQKYANQNSTSITETVNQDEAFEDADIIYAKAWAGPIIYTNPTEEERIRKASFDWQITEKKMALTNQAGFMHCLPVRRNVVVSNGVMDVPDPLYLMQAEFRLHAQKAILADIWGV